MTDTPDTPDAPQGMALEPGHPPAAIMLNAARFIVERPAPHLVLLRCTSGLAESCLLMTHEQRDELVAKLTGNTGPRLVVAGADQLPQ